MGLTLLNLNDARKEQLKKYGFTITNGFYVLTKDFFDEITENQKEKVTKLQFDYFKYNKPAI